MARTTHAHPTGESNCLWQVLSLVMCETADTFLAHQIVSEAVKEAAMMASTGQAVNF